MIQRSGRTVTYLRHDVARRFLAEVDGVEEADAQETMARYTGNYKRGNERLADEHPRHQNPAAPRPRVGGGGPEGRGEEP